MFFTDPQRTPDPTAAARTLPKGAAVVWRSFGAADAETQARALKQIARARGLKLLIGQDAALARRVGADGVHLPERLAFHAGPLKRARPDWLVTAAAHSLKAARSAKADAVVISAVFPSMSRTAGRAMGAVRLAALVRRAGRPVYALGGINQETARRLKSVGLIGLAATEGLARTRG